MALILPDKISLLKADVTFTDLQKYILKYILSLKKNAHFNQALAPRIHSLVFPLLQALKQFPYGEGKSTPENYHTLDKGLKELKRRISISLSLNQRHNKEFLGFWKFITIVLTEEAILHKDLGLISTFEGFFNSLNTLQTD